MLWVPILLLQIAVRNQLNFTDLRTWRWQNFAVSLALAAAIYGTAWHATLFATF
jgi:hypothetical protein